MVCSSIYFTKKVVWNINKIRELPLLTGHKMIITKNREKFRVIERSSQLIDLAIEMKIFTESSRPISLVNIEPRLNKLMDYKEMKLTDFRRLISNVFIYKFNNTIEYWVERGFSEFEAKEKISNLMSEAAKKLHDGRTPESRKIIAKRANMAKQEYLKKMKDENPEKLKEQFNTNIEFYLSKGLSLEEAQHALKNRQSTFSTNKMIEKYGEKEGLQKVKERNERWLTSLRENNDWGDLSKSKGKTYEQMVEKFGKEKADDIIYRRSKNGVPFCWASKESLQVFDQLIDWLFEEHSIFYQDIYIGKEDNREFFIKTKESKYSYDFTIKSLNIIIEYNGEAFHPNPSWDEEVFESWKHPYNSMTAQEKRKYDENKIKYAENQGFIVLEIWSSKSPEENLEICKDFILSNINRF